VKTTNPGRNESLVKDEIEVHEAPQFVSPHEKMLIIEFSGRKIE
jgi:hypothetical protein